MTDRNAVLEKPGTVLTNSAIPQNIRFMSGKKLCKHEGVMNINRGLLGTQIITYRTT